MAGTSRFVASEFLDSAEARAEYLRAAVETEDAAFILDATGVLAQARKAALDKLAATTEAMGGYDLDPRNPMVTESNPHTGSTFDSFLAEEGVLDEAKAVAEKRVRDHEAAMAAFKVVNEEDSEILRELARR